MKLNRVILAVAGAAGIALAGACADGARLTSPASRAPGASASVTAAPVDTFCCGTQKQQTMTTATVDTFPKHGQ